MFRCRQARRAPRVPLQTAWFYVLWLFVGFTSVHDGYLMLVYRDVHREGAMELNPVARRLLELSGGEPWSLLAIKSCGTIIVCSVLLLLYRKRRPLALAVVAGLACLQAALLAFIFCA